MEILLGSLFVINVFVKTIYMLPQAGVTHWLVSVCYWTLSKQNLRAWHRAAMSYPRSGWCCLTASCYFWKTH